MTFEVYHDKAPTFMSPFARSSFVNFEHVATIECEDIEDIFVLSNHGDHVDGRSRGDWTTSKCVTPVEGHTGRNTRSTSVGDIAIDIDGQVWYCDRVGWKKEADVDIRQE